VKLAKEFGFCYGVERAIDLAYAAHKAFPDRRIFLLGEIIHNPEVNDQIRRMGIVTIASRPSDDQIEEIKPQDIVIIPAFGTEVATRKKLEARGCTFVDTTCGDVMSVWKRVRQYSKESVTSIIHGKAWHEETLATSSQAPPTAAGHYLVVFNLEETDYVCDYILEGRRQGGVPRKIQGRVLAGVRSRSASGAVGVANQTTMLRGETEEVQRRLRAAMEKKHGASSCRIISASSTRSAAPPRTGRMPWRNCSRRRSTC
jgi:4-hydroxy-3-methylbut-2-enyl diphosphate reductase